MRPTGWGVQKERGVSISKQFVRRGGRILALACLGGAKLSTIVRRGWTRPRCSRPAFHHPPARRARCAWMEVKSPLTRLTDKAVSSKHFFFVRRQCFYLLHTNLQNRLPLNTNAQHLHHQNHHHHDHHHHPPSPSQLPDVRCMPLNPIFFVFVLFCN